MPKVPQGQINGYEIGFSPRGARKISVTMRPNAQDALKTVRTLEPSEEEIRYIKAPRGYEIGIGELQLEAERNGNASVKNPRPPESKKLPEDPVSRALHAMREVTEQEVGDTADKIMRAPKKPERYPPPRSIPDSIPQRISPLQP